MSSPSDSDSGFEPTLAPPRAKPQPEDRALPPLDEQRFHVDTQPDALLGTGGQGSVWRARDAVLRREVALKRLHGEGPVSAAAETAFLSEARLTALLEHPGIVPIHDVGRAANGTATLVMRRIEGKSLAESLNAADDLDARLVLVPALLRACQTVAFAHQHHVVHRDLKPQNIMLGEFGETYVLDWGLAVLEQAAPEGVAGSPAYMSPEQALGLAADVRSDVWGLGACLYQVLTGEPPVVGSSLDSTLRRAVAAEVPSVRLKAPQAPGDLVAICEKALAADRAQRYPSALELSRDLEAWVAGRTVSARSYTPGQLLWRLLKAHRKMVAVVSLALVALLVVLGLDEVRVRRERNEARSFARELLIDIPLKVDTQKPNIALLTLLSSRAKEWLSRTDLSHEEGADACALLTRLAGLHFDSQQWSEADRLAQEAVTWAREGSRVHPAQAAFVACEAGGLTVLGDSALEQGRVDAGLATYAAAEARLEGWSGAPTSTLVLSRAALNLSWGEWLWTREPKEGAQHFVLAAELALTLLDEGDPTIRRSALGYSFNGTVARWSQGRRREAAEMSARFYEAARPLCDEEDNLSLRSCLSALTGYLVFLSWDDDPRAAPLLNKALEVEAKLLSRNTDSTSGAYDSMLFAFERGDFAAASTRALALRAETPTWTDELGPLAAALAGDLDTVDSWAELTGEGTTGAPLALALTEAARGHFTQAAAHLRRIDRARLWYDISWPPHAVVGLRMSPRAQPAFDVFLRDFTSAYGEADMKRLGDSVESFAQALESLH